MTFIRTLASHSVVDGWRWAVDKVAQRMKTLTSVLADVGNCRPPGWSSKVGRKQGLETTENMALCRSRWSSYNQSLSYFV